MPYIRRKRRMAQVFRRKKRTGRNFRRKFKKNTTTSVTVRPRQIFPKRMFVKLPYESGQIGGIGAYSAYQFRANSIFDPDYTGIGHQPRGHDQYSNFFRQYRVHGVKVEVWLENNSDYSQSIVAIYAHKSTTYPPDITSIIENPDCKYRFTNDDKGMYMKRYISMASVFGKRKSVVNMDKDYASNFGSNPTTEGYITIIHANGAGAGDIAYLLRAKLTYYVELSEPLYMDVS